MGAWLEALVGRDGATILVVVSDTAERAVRARLEGAGHHVVQCDAESAQLAARSVRFDALAVSSDVQAEKARDIVATLRGQLSRHDDLYSRAITDSGTLYVVRQRPHGS
jgi:hypothetical protein